MTLTAAQLEAKVLTLVELVLKGNRIEDDQVECKSTWPRADKARQIAGLANRARGAEILLIIGLDEDASRIVPLDGTDPISWWATISPTFDEGVAPNLLHHLHVPINGTESVIALLFECDRAPYLVKNPKGGPPDFEIPIRAATGTRSARRSEIIRMLAPKIDLPGIEVISAGIECDARSIARAQMRGPRLLGPRIGTNSAQLLGPRIEIAGLIELYIEHLGGRVLVIPKHRSTARLTIGSKSYEFEVHFHADEEVSSSPFMTARRDLREQPLLWGVSSQERQLVCTAPGVTNVAVYGDVPIEDRQALVDAAEAVLQLQFGIVGLSSQVKVEKFLSRVTEIREPSPDVEDLVGRWESNPQ